MTRLGAVLALFGFGSAVLHFSSRQLFLMMWAEDWQPAFGLVLGGVGAVLLLIQTLRSNDDAPQAVHGPPQAADGQQGYPPPPGYGPPPGHGTPPGGFAPPAGPVHQPIPHQGPQFGQRPPQGPPQGPPQQRGPGPQSW